LIGIDLDGSDLNGIGWRQARWSAARPFIRRYSRGIAWSRRL